MKNEQTKSLIVNIVTFIVVVGVLAAGYFVFIKKSDVSSSTNAAVSVNAIASETAMIGNEIESTVKDLQDLKSAVESSAIIFSSPAFQNLENFTVPIPEGAVGGRTNPFILTDWKIKFKALEGASVSTTNTVKAAAPQTASPTTPSAPAPESNLMGDFSLGI